MLALRRDARGPRVLDLQILLSGRGYQLARDSHFGPNTERAVRAFQASEGLTVDGLAGPETLARLRAAPGHPPHGVAAGERAAALELIAGLEGAEIEALRAALANLGDREEPAGSNGGPWLSHLVEGYRETWRMGPGPLPPWCAIAVSVWTARGLGLGYRADAVDWKRHPFGAWFGSVGQIERWAREHGCASSAPSVGAIFTMARTGSGSDRSARARAGHCGLVVLVEGDRFLSVEGNTGDAVRLRWRPLEGVRLFVRWSGGD